MKDILRYMPSKISEKIVQGIEDKLEKVEEIRLRIERPIILRLHDGEKVIKYSISTEEMISCLQAICENSIYTYQNQIAEGFVTIKGGHRVGIAGSCVVENGKIININHIYSLNFRIARQVVGSGNKILKYILNLEQNTIYNTLIVSSPGAGKTTILRDIVRQISSGIKEIKFVALNVGVVDERGEIAALYKGAPQNDIGIKTDILDNVPKSIGMKMLIRSMTPEIIVADEIGSFEDIEAIKYAICSGCKGLFTAHGANFEDVSLNPIIKSLIGTNIIERVIFLDEKNRGKVKDVYALNKKNRRIWKNRRIRKTNMIIVKFIIYALIVYICTYLGIYKSKTYEIREKELKNIKNALVFFRSKIEFTYEPIKEIFMQISQVIYDNKNNVFLKCVECLENQTIENSWIIAVEEGAQNIKKEDKEILKMFGKLLGKTDKNGQISEIELTQEFLDKQIEKAEFEKNKNAKLFKSLGTLLGIGIVIILA